MRIEDEEIRHIDYSKVDLHPERAQKYIKTFPKKVKFKIAQGGAQVGINDVAAGRVTIGDVSRDPLADRPRRARSSTRSPSTSICVVTNKANPLSNLTRGAGRSDLHRQGAQLEPGAPARPRSGTIDLISRTSVAGVLTNFQTLLLEGKKVSTLAAEEPSEGLMQQTGRKRPERDRLPVSNYQSRQRRRQRRRPQRRRLQRRRRVLRAVPRRRALLRGDERQGDRRRSAFIGWIENIGRGQEDHRDAVDPARC